MSDVYLWETYEKVGREALERKDFNQAVESFRAAVAVAEKLQGEELRLVMSLRHLSSATAKIGQLSLAHDLLGRTEEIAVTRLGGTHPETVQVKRDLYDLSRQLGHLDQAESYLVEVLGVVRAHGETEEFLEILELLAQLAGERERLDNAAVLYKQIVEARATLYGEDHPSVAQALLWLSTALSRSGQGEAAEAPLSRAFAMLERQFINDPKSLAQSLLAGAELMTSGGRPAAALEHQKRALVLLTSVLEEGNQTLWDTREMIASTLATLGRLEESIELLEYCLQNRQARDHRTGAMLKNLAGLYLSLQRVDKAEVLYRQASELLHKTLGPEHPASLAAIEERIQMYHFTGRSQEALDLALTTIRPTEQRYGPGHPNTAQVYASTAVLAHAARKWDTAFELMKAAEAIWESLTPRPNDVLCNCRLNMATCLVEMGRNAEAALALKKVTLPPGSPLESVVRDLWARLEGSTPAAPAEAPASASGQRRSIKLGLVNPPTSAAPEPEVGSGPRTWDAPPPAALPTREPGTERVWSTSSRAAAEEPPMAAEAPTPAPIAPEPNPFDDITFTELDEEEISDLKGLADEPPEAQAAEVAEPDIFTIDDDDLFSADALLFSETALRSAESSLHQGEESVEASVEVFEDSGASVESHPGPVIFDEPPKSEELPESQSPTLAEAADDPFVDPFEEIADIAPPPIAPAASVGILDESPLAPDLFDDIEPADETPGPWPQAEEPAFEVALEAPPAESAPAAGLEAQALESPLPAEEGPGDGAPSPLWDEPRDLSWDEAENYTKRLATETRSELENEQELTSNRTEVPDAELDAAISSGDQEQTELPRAPAEEEIGEPGPVASGVEVLPSVPEPVSAAEDETLLAVDEEFDPDEGDDRRRSRRFNLGLNRFFDLALRNDKEGLQVIRSFLVDLSTGGLRVNTERPLPVKEAFELTLPADLLREEMQLPARVTWQRALFGATYIQGLEFLKITPEQKARIETILAEGDLSEGGRQHYRLYRPFPIQVSGQEFADWVSSYASDLSVEGVGTRLETEIRNGQKVRLRLGLEFELPTVEVEATVAWSRYGSNGVSHGLRFEEVGPVEARTIKLYIDRCLELSPD